MLTPTKHVQYRLANYRRIIDFLSLSLARQSIKAHELMYQGGGFPKTRVLFGIVYSGPTLYGNYHISWFLLPSLVKTLQEDGEVPFFALCSCKPGIDDQARPLAQQYLRRGESTSDPQLFGRKLTDATRLRFRV